MRHHISRILAVAALLTCAGAQGQATDFEGGTDHAELPRVDGTRIAGYSFAEYDAGRFVARLDGNEPVLVYPEGKRTRIVYAGGENQSALQIFRNYQKAFADMGDFKEVFSCQRAVCDKPKIGRNVVWAADNKVPRDFNNDAYIYTNTSNHESPMYLYGTVVKGDTQYHVSVMTALVTGAPIPTLKNRPIIHVEILEVADFKATLVFVDAAEMASQLSTQGHIALYGIQFDFDSAALKAESDPTISEIAKALESDADMSVYVVGHTDNEGAFSYNEGLSQQRAASVVATLVDSHGIDASRLTPVGVGPVAPVASNDSDDGQALNRRVEIVKR